MGGIGGDPERHMGWKGRGSQTTPIEGNDRTTWWGNHMVAPLLGRNRIGILRRGWDGKTIIKLRRI
jgi:hypothetical protein